MYWETWPHKKSSKARRRLTRTTPASAAIRQRRRSSTTRYTINYAYSTTIIVISRFVSHAGRSAVQPRGIHICRRVRIIRRIRSAVCRTSRRTINYRPISCHRSPPRRLRSTHRLVPTRARPRRWTMIWSRKQHPKKVSANFTVDFSPNEWIFKYFSLFLLMLFFNQCNHHHHSSRAHQSSHFGCSLVLFCVALCLQRRKFAMLETTENNSRKVTHKRGWNERQQNVNMVKKKMEQCRRVRVREGLSHVVRATRHCIKLYKIQNMRKNEENYKFRKWIIFPERSLHCETDFSISQFSYCELWEIKISISIFMCSTGAWGGFLCVRGRDFLIHARVWSLNPHFAIFA